MCRYQPCLSGRKGEIPWKTLKMLQWRLEHPKLTAPQKSRLLNTVNGEIRISNIFKGHLNISIDEMVHPRKITHFYTSLCHTNVIFPQRKAHPSLASHLPGRQPRARAELDSTESSTQQFQSIRANLQLSQLGKKPNYPSPLGIPAPRQEYEPARHRNKGIHHLLLII